MVNSVLCITQKKVKQEYPYLGISNDADGKVIVLFTSKNEGTVVYSSNDHNWNIGEYSDNWVEESCFEPYNGQVILNN
jgi:hypothetical protein